MGDRIHTTVGDTAGEYRDYRRRRRVERIGHVADLIEGEYRGHVEHHALGGQDPDQLVGRLSFRVGDRDFYVHVGSPCGDRARLLGHAGEVVGKHLARHRPIRDWRQYLAREGLVIAHTRLAHEGRIGGEPLDCWIARHLDHAVVISAVGKNLDLEIGDAAHAAPRAVAVVWMMI